MMDEIQPVATLNLNSGNVTGNHFASIGNQTHIDILVEASQDALWWLRPNVAPEAMHDSKDVYDQNVLLLDSHAVAVDIIVRWIDDSYPAVLWVNGDTCTGKSTIALTITNTLVRDDLLLASFFCSQKHGRRSDASLVIPTLVDQIITCIPSLRPIIQAVFDSNPHILTKPLHIQAASLIVKPLESVEPDLRKTLPRVIVIDGLDQLRDVQGQGAILETIKCLVQNTLFPIRCLITSRREPQILEFFIGFSGNKWRPLALPPDEADPDGIFQPREKSRTEYPTSVVASSKIIRGSQMQKTRRVLEDDGSRSGGKGRSGLTSQPATSVCPPQKPHGGPLCMPKMQLSGVSRTSISRSHGRTSASAYHSNRSRTQSPPMADERSTKPPSDGNHRRRHYSSSPAHRISPQDAQTPVSPNLDRGRDQHRQLKRGMDERATSIQPRGGRLRTMPLGQDAPSGFAASNGESPIRRRHQSVPHASSPSAHPMKSVQGSVPDQTAEDTPLRLREVYSPVPSLPGPSRAVTHSARHPGPRSDPDRLPSTPAFHHCQDRDIQSPLPNPVASMPREKEKSPSPSYIIDYTLVFKCHSPPFSLAKDYGLFGGTVHPNKKFPHVKEFLSMFGRALAEELFIALWSPLSSRGPFSSEMRTPQIGDVGFLTPEGGFCSIFNILESSRQQNLHPPPNFVALFDRPPKVLAVHASSIRPSEHVMVSSGLTASEGSSETGPTIAYTPNQRGTLTGQGIFLPLGGEIQAMDDGFETDVLSGVKNEAPKWLEHCAAIRAQKGFGNAKLLVVTRRCMSASWAAVSYVNPRAGTSIPVNADKVKGAKTEVDVDPAATAQGPQAKRAPFVDVYHWHKPDPDAGFEVDSVPPLVQVKGMRSSGELPYNICIAVGGVVVAFDEAGESGPTRINVELDTGSGAVRRSNTSSVMSRASSAVSNLWTRVKRTSQKPSR